MELGGGVGVRKERECLYSAGKLSQPRYDSQTEQAMKIFLN